MRKSETKVLFIIAAVLVLIALAAGLIQLLFYNYEVVEKGQILPYTHGTITKVRLFHRWTLYTEFERLPNLDLVTAFLLAACGWSAFIFSALVKFLGHKRKDPAVGFLFWMGILMTWLAADEYFGLHETIGHNLQWLRALPWIEAPDDFIVLLYGLAAVTGLIIFRRIIAVDKVAIILWGSAAGLGFLTGVADNLTGRLWSRPFYLAEEFSELAIVALILLGLLRLGTTLLRKSLQPAAE